MFICIRVWIYFQHLANLRAGSDIQRVHDVTAADRQVFDLPRPVLVYLVLNPSPYIRAVGAERHE